MTLRAFSLASLLLCALTACGQDEGSGTSDPGDAAQWAVVDLGSTDADVNSFFADVTPEVADVTPEVADTSLADTSWVNEVSGGDSGLTEVEVLQEVSVSDAVEPDPDVSATESWGGGVLIFELASEFVNVAGAGARFTEVATVDGLVDDAAEQWGPCAASISDPDAPEVVEQGFDAGVITVLGTTSEVILSPEDEGADGVGYSSNLDEELESLLPSGGALLTIMGQGGVDIDAFEVVAQVPESVTISSPDTGLFKSASASEDLTVSWNAGTGEAILVTASPLDQAFQTAAGLGLICGADQDTGSLVIPAAAMAAMKSSGVSRVALAVTRLRFGSAPAGDRLVTATITRSDGGPLDLK